MQPEIGRTIRIAVLLLVAVSAWAQEQEPFVGPVETEAPQVAGLVSTEPVASEALVEEARSALGLIRGLAPELATVRFTFFFAPGELLCSLGTDLQARLRAHTGKLSEFDFRDEAMNDLRDRYPLQSIKEVTPNLAKIRFADTSGRYNLALLREKLAKSKVLFGVSRNFYSDSKYRLDPRKLGGSG